MPAPPRPAPTVPDQGAGPAVTDVLRRTRGLPLLVRLVFDAARLALAAGASAYAWSRLAPLLSPVLPEAIPADSHALVLAIALVMVATLSSLLLFRLTSRRFVRPVRGRR